jgi:hypothetical protein
MNVGASNWGNFRGMPEVSRPIPQPPQNQPGIDTGPSQQPWKPPPPPIAMGGGMNVGRGTNMGILPSPMDPFRTYGSVNNGVMTPPQNPFGQNQPIRFTPGGEYGQGPSPGPINVGPSPNIPSPHPPGPTGPSPYMSGGGFTGGQMPQDIQSGSSGASAPKPTGIWNPPPNLQLGYQAPNNEPSPFPNMPQGMRNIGGSLRNTYGGGGGRNRLFY